MPDLHVGDSLVPTDPIITIREYEHHAVRCRCGEEMKPEIGRSLLNSMVFIWWRCEGPDHHVTKSLPLPERIGKLVWS